MFGIIEKEDAGYHPEKYRRKMIILIQREKIRGESFAVDKTRR